MSEFNYSLTKQDISLSNSAIEKIGTLIKDTDGEAEAVRVYVVGGGCSGMQYGMTFAEDAEPSDCVLSNGDKVKLLVDPVTRNFLEGAEIDYVDDGLNTSFVFNNVFQAVGGSGACGGCGGGTAG